MAEPFKNMLSAPVIRTMASHLGRASEKFDGAGFVAFATDGLDGLELKARSSRITDALEMHLPKNFRQATEIMLASLDPRTDFDIGEMSAAEAGGKAGDNSGGPMANGIVGWPVMAMADYVARHGQGDVAFSLDVLHAMTSRSSSEFAIRAFLQNHPQTTLDILAAWCDDPNEHVRRLVSEGSRPRLPWGQRLNQFVADPTPVLALLERLKNDPSEYVRRSVANNLNDISKDHPERVVVVSKRWLQKASKARARLVRHALRSLIKAGHSGALAVLGYGPPQVNLLAFSLKTDEVTLGEALEFELEMVSASNTDQSLIIDYAVHHMRANGKLSPKVFKWKTLTLKAGKTLIASRRHPMKPVTTRRHYPGQHRVEVLVNGQSLGGVDFVLRVD